jgi:hypothetical protein
MVNPFFTKRLFSFNRPKLHLVQLWHFLTNHSTILELEWHGSQLSEAKNSMFLSHPNALLKKIKLFLP